MAFNPDDYLATKPFNPDAYLGIKPNLASQIPLGEGERRMPAYVEPKRTMTDYIKALVEVPATIGSAAALTVPSTVKALVTGSNKPLEMVQKYAYKPESPVSQGILDELGNATQGLPPYLGGGILSNLNRANKALLPSLKVAGNALDTGVTSQATKYADALRRTPESTMSGVGAAVVPEAINRIELAKNLRVPVDLSKGQAQRDLGQQKFEIETPKNNPELGRPLIEAQAGRNEALLQNFDAFVDATGKETFGLRETGKVVDKALVNATNKAKKEINDAYTLARESGETQQAIPYEPLTTYLDKQTPTIKATLAPILKVVEEEIARNDIGKTGKITINNIDDIYKVINENYEIGTIGAKKAKEMKDIINAMTEGQGGELYQKARALRTKYGRQYEDTAIVDDLLRKKKGSADRVVDLENIFKHSMLDGSLDDVQFLGRTLKKAGKEGEQAWKELQGQTIQHLKDKVTKNIDKDIYGNPVVSPAQFQSAVRELDQGNKLDYIFGKSGAQEIRDLLETTLNVNNPLKGATNYSNTSSALITALDKIENLTKGIPIVSSVSEFSANKAKNQALKKQVQESINYAKELRKGE